MKKRILITVIVSGIIAVSAITMYVFYKAKYPYGQSHCCIIGIAGGLEQYAVENGGHYPTGGPTAEASLSLLCQSNMIDPYTIRGMTVPEKTVRTILASGKLLGPDSCGWHYTDGLTCADDPKLALLYCKQALGHNGQKTPDGGRQVVFVGGNIEWIAGDKWPAFLAEQNELLSKRSDRAKSGKPLVDAIIELPDGRQIENVNDSYTIQEQNGGPDSFSGNETSGGNSLRRDGLVWFSPPLQNQFSGYVTRILSFSNLVSAPITVRFSNGIPDKTSVVFKMQIK